jgi:hypothetical protein
MSASCGSTSRGQDGLPLVVGEAEVPQRPDLPQQPPHHAAEAVLVVVVVVADHAASLGTAPTKLAPALAPRQTRFGLFSRPGPARMLLVTTHLSCTENSGSPPLGSGCVDV